jgi:transcriptional regulator with XRE-family HTH domain
VRRVPSPKSSVTAEFGRRVRVLRKAADWSQEQLAAAAGMHFTYVASVERGERNISLENIVRLGHALDVDVAELMSGL